MSRNRWLLLTEWTIGSALAMGFGLSLTSSLAHPTNRFEILIAGFLVGAVVGLVQWRANRGKLRVPKWWVSASVIGWGAGVSLLVYEQNCVNLGFPGCFTESAYSNDTGFVLSSLGLGALIGAAIGALQWLPSGIDVRDSRRKIMLSSGYLALGGLVLSSAHRAEVGDFIVLGASLGCMTGAAQWFFVHRRITATERWIFSYGIGWAAAMIVAWMVANLISDSGLGGGTGVAIATLGATGAAAGLFVGGLHLLSERASSDWTVRWLAANVIGWSAGGLAVGIFVTSINDFGLLLGGVGPLLGGVGGLVTGSFLYLVPSPTLGTESPS